MGSRTVFSGGTYSTLTAALAAITSPMTEDEYIFLDSFDCVDTAYINKDTGSFTLYVLPVPGTGTNMAVGTACARIRNGTSGVNSPLRFGSLAKKVFVGGIKVTNENAGLGSGPVQFVAASAGSDITLSSTLMIDKQSAGVTFSVLANVANLNLKLQNCAVLGNCRSIDTRGAASVKHWQTAYLRTTAQLGVVSSSESEIKNCVSVSLVSGSEDFWSGGTPTGSNNISSDTTAVTRFGAGSLNNIAAAALFASVTAGAEDFRPLSGSTVMRDAGVTIAALTTDALGTARPQGSAYDIGPVEYTSGTAPSITTQPSNASVVAGATATFTAAASGSPTPTYRWQRNPGGVGTWADISGATGASYTTPATTVSGGSANNGDTFRMVATNASGSATSTAATLTVSAANSPPTFPGPSIADLALTVGTAMSAVNVASKFSDTDALTFSAVGTWPAGVSISSAGVISGTPTVAGNYTGLTVRATDTASQTVDSNTFTITVAAVTATLNFQATGMEFGARTGLGISTFALDVGSAYRYTVHADGLVLGAAIYTSGTVTTDSAGKLPNLVDASIVAGTAYRVHAIRQSDGASVTFRMTAT